MKEQLIKCPYFHVFDCICDITNISSLLLDNMEVWGIYRDIPSRKLPFDIIISSDEKYITPRCKPGTYDKFLLAAERVYLVDEIFENEMGKSIFVSELK